MAYPYTAFQNQYYNPYQPPMQDQLTALRQQQFQPVQQQNSNPIIWVQGEEGAKGYLVSAGNSVLLMDSEKNAFYIKSTDTSGMPLPLRVFDYTERSASPRTAQVTSNASNQYVTLEQFNALSERLEALENKPCKCKEKKVKEDAENA